MLALRFMALLLYKTVTGEILNFIFMVRKLLNIMDLVHIFYQSATIFIYK